MIGSFVDSRYVVKELLGQGNMASVYLAEDTINGNAKVALKVIKKELNSRPDLRRRFRGEFEVCERFNHRNIVKVYSMGDLENGLCYYAMEYLPYPALEDILEKTDRLSEETVLVYLRQIASAFEHFHPMNIIHRDLKPANIIIGGNDRVILVDFGLAKDEDRTVLTKTGMIIGTPLYLSPEQVTAKKVDNRSDIWALGVLGYRMLSGIDPFRDKNMQLVANKILKGRPKPITEIVEGIKPKWNAFFRKCFKKKREDRFQRGDEVLEALDRLAGGLAPGKLLESASQGNTSLIEAVELVDGEKKEEAAPIDKRKQAFALLFGLFVTLALLWSAGVFGSGKYVADDLVVLPGVGFVELRWRSDKPYPSKVVLDGESSKVYKATDEGEDGLQHRVIIKGLGEGKRYGFSILFPSGEKTPSRWVQTDEFVCRFHECKAKDDTGFLLTLYVPGAKSGLLRMNKEKDIEGETKETDDSLNFLLPRPLEIIESLSLTLDFGSGSTRRLDLRALLLEVMKEYGRKAEKIDLQTITDKRYVHYAASLSAVMDTVQRKKGSLEISKEMKAKELERKQGFANETSKIIESRLRATGIKSAYDEAAHGSALILGTSLFDYERRMQFYTDLRKILEPMLFTAYQRGPHFGWPLPDMGRFGISHERFEGECDEIVLLGPNGERKKNIRLGSSTPFVTHIVPSREKITFEIASPSLYDGVELAIAGSGFNAGAVRLEINDAPPIFFYGPPLVPRARTLGTVYQRLPIEALRRGRNDMSMVFDAIERQRVLHTMTFKVLVLRLRRKAK